MSTAEFKGKTAAQLDELRQVKLGEVQAIFDKHPDMDLSGAEKDQIKALHLEINDIGAMRDEQKQLEDIAASTKALQDELNKPIRPNFGGNQNGNALVQPAKSVAAQFVESKQFTSMLTGKRKESDAVEIDVDLKTLMTTTTGWIPEATRSGLVVPFATRPIQVTDIIPTIQTTQNAYVYMEETTFTNAAAETAEGALKPEAALALTERTSPVRKIAVWIPVTDEQLEDVPGIQSYIEQRLAFMVRQRLDGQILVGDGIAPNLRGILNVVGIQTQANAANVPDAIFNAMTLIRTGTGQAVPSAVILNPADWAQIRLLTASGVYIWGPPMDAGPERIWGVPVVLAEALTAGTGIVGDFQNYSLLVEKKQMTIKVGYIDDYFIRNQRCIVAEIRVAFVITRPAAFATVTGI